MNPFLHTSHQFHELLQLARNLDLHISHQLHVLLQLARNLDLHISHQLHVLLQLARDWHQVRHQQRRWRGKRHCDHPQVPHALRPAQPACQ